MNPAIFQGESPIPSLTLLRYPDLILQRGIELVCRQNHGEASRV